MTVFDLAALLILAVSVLVGISRGAVREIVTLIAFTAAALLAVFMLPISGGLFRRLVQPPCVGVAAAVVVVFVIAYVALRLLGSSLTSHLQGSSFGGVNRLFGGLFGAVRGLVVLAAFALVFNAVTPRELRPAWIIGGVTWPLAQATGAVLASFAPQGMRIAGGLGRSMGDGVKRGLSDSDAIPLRPKREFSLPPLPAPAPPDEFMTKPARSIGKGSTPPSETGKPTRAHPASPPAARPKAPTETSTAHKAAQKPAASKKTPKSKAPAYDAQERQSLTVLVDRAR